MNPYGFIGVLLVMAGLGSWAVWERGSAESWQNKYLKLQSSYTQASQQAKDDAAKIEAADLANLKSQTTQAISQAQAGQKEAQQQLQSYQAKLAAAAMDKDLGHRCARVEVPKDLIP